MPLGMPFHGLSCTTAISGIRFSVWKIPARVRFICATKRVASLIVLDGQ